MNRPYEITYVLPNEDGEEQIETDCLSFTDDEICSADLEACGPWGYNKFASDPRRSTGPSLGSGSEESR